MIKLLENMKKTIKFAMVLFVAFGIIACADNDNIGNEYLDVTFNNISGDWKMESYEGGITWADGSYYYITFNRKDRTFVSYDNLDSMEAVRLTGRYDIVTNEASVIFGMYDYRGDWEHRYYVRDLTKDRMVWVAVDDESIVRVYVRAELPEWLPKEDEK